MANKRKLQDFEITYHANKDLFPPDFRDSIDVFLEFKDFHFNVRKVFIDEAKPLMRKLMNKQFNGFKTLTNTDAIEYIDSINQVVLYSLIGQLNNLCKLCRQKEDPHVKYPKLEEWRKFYVEPQKPSYTKEEDRKYLTYITDEEWPAYKEKEDKIMLEFFLWKQKRQNEFYELLQPMVSRYLPELENLEGDYWVLYAVSFGDIYEEWKCLNEHLETIIDYGMPLEYIKLKHSALIDLMMHEYSGKSEEVAEKRYIKIANNE